jgi:UDP-glucuronate 4-epimerase
MTDYFDITPQLSTSLAHHKPWFAGKTFLVTGGAGFIGHHTVRHLLEMGSSVIVVDDFNDYYDPAIKRANIQGFLNHSSFTLVEADIRDAEAMTALIARHADALSDGGVVHLAARAGVRPSLSEPRLYLETNVTGTLNLLEAMRPFPTLRRFTFASSSSVYGSAPDNVPFSEGQDVTRPISPYAATKLQGEALLHTYSHLHGFNVVGLRFFTVYGAGQRPDLAIHKFTKMIDEGKPIPVYGDGSTRRDYTYIDDIVQGVLAAIRYDETPFELVNLGESHTTTLAELIGTLEAALDKQAIIDRQPLQPGDVPITYANIDKAKQLLNYQPTTLIKDGIPKFVDWYRQTHSAMAVN